MARALLLDVGGVVIRTPFELLAAAERAYGLAAGALGPRGPFGDEADPEFDRVANGDLSEREYWQLRAERAAGPLGSEPTTSSLIRVLFDRPEDELVRPEVRSLIADARAAGIPVGGLTNDLSDFHGQAWVERMTVFDELDPLVDGSRTGVLKPDPGAYRLAVEAMGIPADQLVLVDDQPVNLAGAEAAGMHTVRLDPTRPAAAAGEVRTLFGLPRPDQLATDDEVHEGGTG